MKTKNINRIIGNMTYCIREDAKCDIKTHLILETLAIMNKEKTRKEKKAQNPLIKKI